MNLSLTDVEVRVLGALVEKESTTPEYYPLSLNALVNACNQKSNREPVMNLDEDAVRGAIRRMNEEGLTRFASTSDSRVPKYEHRLNETFNFHRHEIAILCVLLLRGSQTPGELRTRAERIYAFEDLESVHSALNLLMKREPPLAKVLPRQPGTKESRYVQLFSEEQEYVSGQKSAKPAVIEASAVQSKTDRLAVVEAEVVQLRADVTDMQKQFAAFRKQFE